MVLKAPRIGVTISGLTAVVGLLATKPAEARAPEPMSAAVTRAGEIELPLRSATGFPLVNGDVNGRSGYFLLDTGTPYTAFLNATFLQLPRGKEIARGVASSGQKIVVYRNGCLKSLRVATRYTLDRLCDLPGTDLAFVATGMKLPILGFLGDALFEPYRLTFDWSRKKATLADRQRPIEPGTLTTFRFAAQDKQVPSVLVMAGTVPLPGGMDSGDSGHVILSRADAAKLLAAGRLIDRGRGHGEPRYVLPRVEHDNCALDTSDLPVTVTDAGSSIMLGYLFLQKYISTWDYRERDVRLYAIK